MDGAASRSDSPRTRASWGSRRSTRISRCSTTCSPRDNFYAGRELRAALACRARCAFCGGARWRDETTATLERLQVELDFDGDVGLLSGGQRQAVAVSSRGRVRVERRDPRRADGCARHPRVATRPRSHPRLRDENRAVVVVVSHAMDHVMEVADRAVVMRRGRKVGEIVPSPETYQEIVSLIVGGGG